MVKPLDWPSPRTGAGLSAKNWASRSIPPSVRVARWVMAGEAFSFPGRSDHGLKEMKPRPAFWPEPEGPWPTTR